MRFRAWKSSYVLPSNIFSEVVSRESLLFSQPQITNKKDTRIYDILRFDITVLPTYKPFALPLRAHQTLDFFTVKGSSPPKPPVASTPDTLTSCPWFTKEYHFSHGIIAKVPGTLEVN